MSSIYDGLTIGDKHTYRDFGLIMTSCYIPEPEPKVERINLPFSSGSIDLTDATGVTPYSDRNGLSFKFTVKNRTKESFTSTVQNLAMFLHGKSLKLVPDFDLTYYYIVRLSVDGTKTNAATGEITLKGVSDPFKYASVASNEPWKWDSFNFNTGVIQDTSDITVNGTKNVNIIANGVPTCPEFYVSSITNALSVTYAGKEYKFLNGVNKTYRFPQLRISDNTTLKFSGTGKVSISYRSRSL